MQKLIDLSSNNPDVTSWAMVKAVGFEGVMNRATIGLNQVDHRFIVRTLASHASGLLVGATHLFYPSDDPKLQAQQFAQTVKRFSPLLLAVDLEDVMKNGKDDWTGITIGPDMLNAFLDELSTFFKGDCIPYGSASFLNQYFPNYPFKKLWVADYSQDPPRLPSACPTYTLWQTGQGEVAGVQGPVDLDQTADGVKLEDLFCAAL